MSQAMLPRSVAWLTALGLALVGCGGSGRNDAGRGGVSISVDGLGGAITTGGSGAGSGGGGLVDSGGSSGGGADVNGGKTNHPAMGGSVSSGGFYLAGSTGLGGRAYGGHVQTGGTANAGGKESGAGGAEEGAGGIADTGGAIEVGGQAAAAGRLISFGTLLDPAAVLLAAKELAASLADPGAPDWRATGDQHRTYDFPEVNSKEPYRIHVPTNWDGESELPLVMFLHGAGSNENTYLDQNDQQLLELAQDHGFLLVSPLGAEGAYGNFLRLSAPFGNQEGAASLMAQVTEESERTNQLSEQDVINVLELVLAEYPIDRAAMFLAGHSMGSGGTWYIGGKYASYWKALAPMSGPFVQESGYPWEALRRISILVTEGTQTPSLDASRLLRDWLQENDFAAEYEEVDADHGGMISLVLPNIFDFFERMQQSTP